VVRDMAAAQTLRHPTLEANAVAEQVATLMTAKKRQLNRLRAASRVLSFSRARQRLSSRQS